MSGGGGWSRSERLAAWGVGLAALGIVVAVLLAVVVLPKWNLGSDDTSTPTAADPSLQASRSSTSAGSSRKTSSRAAISSASSTVAPTATQTYTPRPPTAQPPHSTATAASLDLPTADQIQSCINQKQAAGDFFLDQPVKNVGQRVEVVFSGGRKGSMYVMIADAACKAVKVASVPPETTYPLNLRRGMLFWFSSDAYVTQWYPGPLCQPGENGQYMFDDGAFVTAYC